MKTPEDLLDRISNQMNEILSNGKQTTDDIRTNVKALVQAQLAKLDVVSREEFETQQAILVKTREQLDKLKGQLDALEKQINASDL